MTVECNLIISLLKLTKERSVLTEDVEKDSRTPSATSWNLLLKLQNEGLIYLKTNNIEVDSGMRLKLAVKAATLGADMEHISHLLSWQEFEEIAAFALKTHGFNVVNNLHFKNESRKYEIDVIGCRKPLVICVDCKHWQHSIAPSSLRKIVDAQIERARVLSDSLPNKKLKLECTKWQDAKFIPAILSLLPSSFKFYYNVPIVPIFQMQNFLIQLPGYTESLKYFHKTFNSLSNNL